MACKCKKSASDRSGALLFCLFSGQCEECCVIAAGNGGTHHHGTVLVENTVLQRRALGTGIQNVAETSLLNGLEPAGAGSHLATTGNDQNVNLAQNGFRIQIPDSIQPLPV